MTFSGKVVLITGASAGIGEYTALHFASLGASLALTGRNEENLKTVGDKCAKLTSVKPFVVAGDLTNDDDVRRIFNETTKHFGKLDVLVNNAGGGPRDSITSASLETFDYVLRANTRSVYLLTSLAVPYLEKTKGNVVNVSSVLGIRSVPEILSYSVAKSALDQFTKCVALELAPKQIRVNSVNPAVIKTTILKRSGLLDEQIQAFYDHGATTHPQGRVGTSDEVARAIAFLASDNASFTTGALLTVDGGYALACPR